MMAVNIYFVLTYVVALGINSAWFIFVCILVAVAYLSFCAYLTVDMMLNMGGGLMQKAAPPHKNLTHLFLAGECLVQHPIVRRFFTVASPEGEGQEEILVENEEQDQAALNEEEH